MTTNVNNAGTTQERAGLMSKATKASNTNEVRILIVDDHSIVRRGLIDVIQREPELTVCAEASTAQDALTAVRDLKPHLALIDLSLKEISGIELIKQMRAMHPDVAMLVLSMHDELVYAERVLRAGALGYVMKAEATEKLVKAIRTVLRGEIFVSDKMSYRILGRMLGTKADLQGSPLSALSDRELEVFEELGKGQGTRQIAQKMCVSIKTIESHRESIKSKLNLKSANELVHLATHWVMREGAG